jgi:tricorn protease
VAARDSRQFDLAVSRLFGELNASHLSFLPLRWPGEAGPAKGEKKTAHCGIVFDDKEPDPLAPLKVARVIDGSPVSEIASPPRPGEIVVRLGGKEVTNGSPLHEFLNGAVDNVVPIVIRDAKGRERTIEARGISYDRARQLDLKEREIQSRKLVAERAPGTAYLAVRVMNRQAMETLRVEVHRAADRHERLILDLRNNGGGREADRMLAMFTQVRHAITRHRGGPEGYPLDRLYVTPWHGPLVVLCNENTYSNSEIFCHAIQQTGRAPLVGTPTAGGVISAVKRRIPGAGDLQVPFRSWFDVETNDSLDLNGARPDHLVECGPADEDAGADSQLAKAIELIRASR